MCFCTGDFIIREILSVSEFQDLGTLVGLNRFVKSPLLIKINFHVNTLTYSFRFCLILRITAYKPWGFLSHWTRTSATASLTLGRFHSHKLNPFSYPFSVKNLCTIPVQTTMTIRKSLSQFLIEVHVILTILCGLCWSCNYILRRIHYQQIYLEADQ